MIKSIPNRFYTKKVNNDTSVVRPVSYFYRDGGNNAFEKQSDYTYYDSGKLKSKMGWIISPTIYCGDIVIQYPGGGNQGLLGASREHHRRCRGFRCG